MAAVDIDIRILYRDDKSYVSCAVVNDLFF